MPKTINLKGQRFGKLLVISFVGYNKYRYALWECLCDCGNTTTVPSGHLRSGNTESCGCGKGKFTHGQSRCNAGEGTPEYKTWQWMIARIRDKREEVQRNYAGRGITVCQRWQTFAYFLEDMGLKPSPKHSIDRIDNDKGYRCGCCDDCHEEEVFECNCRWATKKEQDRNKRTNRLIEYNGKILCLTEWAERLGVPAYMLYNRLSVFGWTVEQAFTLPKGSRPK